jgi:phosphinothricin acetyltransferase
MPGRGQPLNRSSARFIITLVEPIELNIRPAAEADLEAMNTIYNAEIATGTATWDVTPWTLDQRRAWFAGHDALNPVLVAEAGGELAGFAYVTLVSQKHGWRFTERTRFT